jgi:hypothetical protein
MRRTLFIETKEMIPIVHAATFKLIEKSFEKYMEFRGITQTEYHDISNQILNILKGKELSAAEIRKKLNSKLDVPGIIQVMCNNRLLIRAKPIKDWKDRRNRYSIFNENFPDVDINTLSEEQAIQILVDKYLKAYGPATESDISWWSGLTKTKIRKSLNKLESQLIRIQISKLKGDYLLYENDIDNLENVVINQKPTLIFLPQLDPYPMGYKERDRYIDKNKSKYVFDKSGNITSAILLNGVIIGIWDTDNKDKPLTKFHLFQPLEQELKELLFSKAEKVGKFFFDEDVEITECKSMLPLTERNAGGFMTPLKNY